ncbi:MAG: hypothetical protein HY077_15575 [Elusimicrobia bacterium]|nr:hypothetical protein [Elusimicrobiota bacterium]
MRPFALIVCLSSVLRAAEPQSMKPLYSGVPDAAAKEIKRLEADMAKTLTGRRLLAETDGVERRGAVAGLLGTDAVRCLRGPKPVLVYDLGRLSSTREWEFELAYARALAKAALAIPLDLPEADMAAAQEELSFALDKAKLDPTFSSKLHQQANAMRAKLESTLRLEAEAPYPPPTPFEELARAAFHLALFERGPDEFYWAVERGLPESPERVRLTDLEDFSARYGPTFAAEEPADRIPYVRVGGRRYPKALWTAARSLVESGGLKRIQESLAGFEGGPAQQLQERIKKWLSKSS